MKTCIDCGHEKPEEQFAWHRHSVVRRNYCRPCGVDRTRRYSKAHPEVRIEQRARAKRWRTRHPESAREVDRRKLLKGYGLTFESYDALLAS